MTMTINSMFQDTVKRFGNKTAMLYKEKESGGYKSITYAQLATQVKYFSLGLIALGIEPQDRLAILSENRPPWAISDLAILSAAAITVPMFSTLPDSQIEYIVNDSGAKAIVVSTQEQLKKALAVLKNASHLKSVIIMDKVSAKPIEAPLFNFDEINDLGVKLNTNKPELYQNRLESVKPEDIATIIYTSGTTGAPKGVMLTHHNFIWDVEMCLKVVKVDENDVFLSFLPLPHIFERMAGHFLALRCGSTIGYAESIRTVSQNFTEVKPTVMCSVPRLYEQMHQRIIRNVENSSPTKRKLFYWSVKVGERVSQRLQAKQNIPGFLNMKFRLANKLVFSKLKERTGGRLRFFISGGAPLPKSIAEFFHAAGILILEGYGLTETSPVISVNTVENYKFGAVGKPIPGVEVKIAEDGEILTRGGHVMKGYFNKPEETKETITSEGWFHTGDIGVLDQDGFLKITDRKKNLIVLSNGKNVAPQPIENQMLQSPYVDQLMLIGDKRKVISALIVPNFENLKDYAQKNNIKYQNLSELIGRSEIKRLLKAEIDSRSENLADFEKIRLFTLMEKEFTQEDDEMTPTLKLKRKVIAQKYAELIERMYGEETE